MAKGSGHPCGTPLRAAAACAGVVLAGATTFGQGNEGVLDRADYADRLRGMWLAQVVGNWTGLRLEGSRIAPPFFTDAAWGVPPAAGQSPLGYVFQDPWGADDDTDIEYVYLHALTQTGAVELTPEQVRDAWVAHVNGYIWVSNARARALMSRGVLPPMTGARTPNELALQIDAQLTTEFFGALAPCMPGAALVLADMPIRTTAAGYAAHASQLYVALYALAASVDQALSGPERVVWLTNEARKYIPDSSKAADVIDFVLADFLANPDADDWERTRDAVYARYQLNAGANGFVYRAWTESTVNLATGLIALLYGRGELGRTIQIGTLSGWDCDNGTATMAGLLGLLNGTAWVRAAFPGVELSDRFWAARTRENLPDYLPGDPAADDTFTMMSQRMLAVVDRVVASRGGVVHPLGWVLPPSEWAAGVLDAPVALGRSPTQREQARSANNRVRAEGGTVTASASLLPPYCAPWQQPAFIADGYEHDWSGREDFGGARAFLICIPTGAPLGSEQALTVAYDRAVEVGTIRFIEGEHYSSGANIGGWFESAVFEVYTGAGWSAPAGSASAALDAGVPFQLIDFTLDAPVSATAVRVRGQAGGPQVFVTCMELDALAPAGAIGEPGFDVNGDGAADLEDLYAWFALPPSARGDLNSDGARDDLDTALLIGALRGFETRTSSARP